MAMEEGNGMSSYVNSSSLVGPRPAKEGCTYLDFTVLDKPFY
jgi:hypothetical protein